MEEGREKQEEDDGRKKNKEISTQHSKRCQKYLLCSKFPGLTHSSNSNPIQRDESVISDKITKFVSDTIGIIICVKLSARLFSQQSKCGVNAYSISFN